jgi:hypothetical protein
MWLAERQYLALSASLKINFSVGLSLNPTTHGESRIKRHTVTHFTSKLKASINPYKEKPARLLSTTINNIE